MSYFCKNCGEEHDGFPDYAFAYPEEYLHLSDEDKQKYATRISENVVKIKHKDHYHYYVHVFWPLKVKGADTPWMFKVWLLLPPADVNRLKNMKHGDVFQGCLQSEFPWYGKSALGYPVQFEYDKEYDELYVFAVMPNENNKLVEDFTEGMPLNLALDWLNGMMKQVKQYDCDFKSKIK